MENMLRPKMEVLPDSAQIPERNFIDPAPTHFTHVLSADQPFFYEPPQEKSEPAGTFLAGTKLVVMGDAGDLNRHVVDGRGLYVVTASTGLRALS
jgi:hypothetical protein